MLLSLTKQRIVKDEDALVTDKTKDRTVTIRDYDMNLFTGHWEKGNSQAGYGYFKHVENDKNDCQQGHNVSTYVGEFSNGTMNGQGRLYQASYNSEFQGSFKDGAPCGHGVCNWRDGSGWHYSGEWRDDQMHGQGKRCRVDETGEEECYEGDWIEGECAKNNFEWFRIAARTLPIF